MRALVVLSVVVWAGAMIHLVRAGIPTLSRLAFSLTLLALSALLFAVTRSTTPAKILPAAFSEGGPAQIVETGPYRFVRHPFYVSYMLYWTALALAAPHPLVVAGVVVIIGSYVLLGHGEEQRLLAGPLGAEYRRYFDATGRFLPRFGRR